MLLGFLLSPVHRLCGRRVALTGSSQRPANPRATRPRLDAVARNRPTRSFRSCVSSPPPGAVATASRAFPGLTRTLTLDRRSIVATLGGLLLGVQDSHLRGLLEQVRCALKGRRQPSRHARRARAEVIQAGQAHLSVGVIPDQDNNWLPAHHKVRFLLFGSCSEPPCCWRCDHCVGRAPLALDRRPLKPAPPGQSNRLREIDPCSRRSSEAGVSWASRGRPRPGGLGGLRAGCGRVPATRSR